MDGVSDDRALASQARLTGGDEPLGKSCGFLIRRGGLAGLVTGLGCLMRGNGQMIADLKHQRNPDCQEDHRDNGYEGERNRAGLLMNSEPPWLSAGAIEVSKGGVGRKPRTWLALASTR